ncbi:hypothetical protein FG386_003093 [Cryptosporidium ryanae]|uniref:uncharacterized protein n=1 Tax=Cryptosporidium ryanae TaxID=515981 RepID=UPI00351A1621|nr:hypothetical protein FG386_003093 [Cryptosporidium ryanae]
MYKEEIELIEKILDESEESQIWSVYSLCNHNRIFGDIEKCKNILFEIRNKEKYELIYLIFIRKNSNEFVNTLKYESELLNNNFEFNSSNIYGIVNKNKINTNEKCLNREQFYIECEDIYKNMNTIELLAEKLWYSSYSKISNVMSTKTRINKKGNDNISVNGVYDDLNSNKNDLKVRGFSNKSVCKTEPYPILINKENDSIEKSENNTDPYPVKLDKFRNDIKLEKNDNYNMIKENISKIEGNKVEVSLFENDDDIINNGLDSNSNNQVKSEVIRKNVRKRTKIDSVDKSNAVSDENKHLNNRCNSSIESNYDPSKVQPIVYSKIKKEKIYQDTKTGYLVVEDDVNFVIEKDYSEKPLHKKSNSSSDSILKHVKNKKTNINTDSKQQTLNSFFKIVNKNK